jgi:hypothetical protein
MFKQLCTISVKSQAQSLYATDMFYIITYVPIVNKWLGKQAPTIDSLFLCGPRSDRCYAIVGCRYTQQPR